MSGTWWVGQNELDEDQRNIISLPQDDQVLVTGPPGSGKTNLLLLRANYLHLAGKTNLAIVTFTRSLREFIAKGATQYDFPVSKIMTCREWQHDFLQQYGSHISLSGDFEKDRETLLLEMTNLADKLQLSKVYDAILLDEAQDYTPDEIRLFARLTERLFCVADKRQKIYSGDDSIDTINNCVDKTVELRFHYRNGLNICRVADELSKRWHGYRPLAETSNYDEESNPSTVDSFQCQSIEEQADKIISRLDTQRVAFPDQQIGILCPKKETMDIVWNSIVESQHSDAAFLLHGSASNEFSQDKQVIISTFHAAKGLEFRALHLAGCDELHSFNNNRRLAFTAVTRAKTALSVYHCGNLHGYFDAAIRALEPDPNLPSLDDVFGGSQ